LQADPIRFHGGDVNIYRYCGNNPVNALDPMGLCEKVVDDIIDDLPIPDPPNHSLPDEPLPEIEPIDPGQSIDLPNPFPPSMPIPGGGGDGGWTVGLRLNFSGGPIDATVAATIDGHGNVDITKASGPGLTGGLSITAGLTTTNAGSVDSLHGWGNSLGFSAGEGLNIENNIVWGNGYVGGDFGIGIGAGLPITPQGARTKTSSFIRQ